MRLGCGSHKALSLKSHSRFEFSRRHIRFLREIAYGHHVEQLRVKRISLARGLTLTRQTYHLVWDTVLIQFVTIQRDSTQHPRSEGHSRGPSIQTQGIYLKPRLQFLMYRNPKYPMSWYPSPLRTCYIGYFKGPKRPFRAYYWVLGGLRVLILPRRSKYPIFAGPQNHTLQWYLKPEPLHIGYLDFLGFGP